MLLVRLLLVQEKVLVAVVDISDELINIITPLVVSASMICNIVFFSRCYLQ